MTSTELFREEAGRDWDRTEIRVGQRMDWSPPLSSHRYLRVQKGAPRKTAIFSTAEQAREKGIIHRRG